MANNRSDGDDQLSSRTLYGHPRAPGDILDKLYDLSLTVDVGSGNYFIAHGITKVIEGVIGIIPFDFDPGNGKTRTLQLLYKQREELARLIQAEIDA